MSSLVGNRFKNISHSSPIAHRILCEVDSIDPCTLIEAIPGGSRSSRAARARERARVRRSRRHLRRDGSVRRARDRDHHESAIVTCAMAQNGVRVVGSAGARRGTAGFLFAKRKSRVVDLIGHGPRLAMDVSATETSAGQS